MGRCACNTSSVTKYRNSRIISDILLAGHLFFDKKIFDIANSTIGKASGSLGWDGKAFPRQMLILELYIQKKVVNFGAEPKVSFFTTINPALLPDTNIPACLTKQQ